MKPNMKRVLFIITGLVGGGAEKALLNLLQALDKEQYEIDVLVVFRENSCKAVVSGVTYYSLFSSHKDYGYRIAKHIYLNFHVVSFLRCITRSKIQKSYDTIVSFLEGDSLLYHSFVLDRAKKNISWVHTDFEENHWSKRHFASDDETKAYASMDGLVFVSEYAQQQFRKVMQYPADIKQYVCPNIINEEEITRKAKESVNDVLKHTFTICSVGRLEYVKGYDMVIEAARVLKQQGISVDFWIVGTGSESSDLRTQLQKSGCDEMVHFVGYKKNPYPYMDKSDVFLSSSRAEGLPLVLGEAMCLEKPIIATCTMGAQTMLQNGTYGMLVGMSSADIARAVMDMQTIANRQHYAEASKEGKGQFNVLNVLNTIKFIL